MLKYKKTLILFIKVKCSFIFISLISRGLRFFIVSYLSFKFGETFTKFMNQHGHKWFTILGVIIVIIIAAFYLLLKFYG